MRKLLYTLACALLAGLLVAYSLWTDQRPVGHYLSDLRSEVAVNQGQPGERGNLLGIQPELFAADYQSVERLRLKLAAYLGKARDQGLLNARTIVVLPEHVGTWLVATGEKPQVYEAHHLDEAMLWLAAANPLRLARALASGHGDDRFTDAVFRMKARRMADDYQALFGGLARDFGVTLVAGSILLPAPRVEGGTLLANDGPLYNVSLVFDAHGLPIGQPQPKLHPDHHERAYTQAGTITELSALDTPAGRLGVLLGEDGRSPEGRQALAEQGAELLAYPAFAPGNGSWERPLAGGAHALDLWREQLHAPQARAALAVFLRGQLWDLGSDGRGLAGSATDTTVADAGRGAKLVNIWL